LSCQATNRHGGLVCECPYSDCGSRGVDLGGAAERTGVEEYIERRGLECRIAQTSATTMSQVIATAQRAPSGHGIGFAIMVCPFGINIGRLAGIMTRNRPLPSDLTPAGSLAAALSLVYPRGSGNLAGGFSTA
jgi:hypothetical protein